MGRDIRDIRKEIDDIDDELLDLLHRRSELSHEMGALKRELGIGIHDPSREAAVLECLMSKVKPPLPRSLVQRVFIEIFSASRSLQERIRISFLGSEGSFSHQAALSLFGHDTDLVPTRDIESIVGSVESGRTFLGVVPVENTTEGMVNRTLDLMAASRLFVSGEILLPVKHCLLTPTPGGTIEKVFSHPQAFAQCRNWIQNNLPGAELVDMPSTSEAAKAAAHSTTGAAIASSLSAELEGLTIHAENINDVQENITRFWVISREMINDAANTKTSIIVTLQNKPGALYDALGVFARAGLNLTKIESRPSRKNPWEYIFFIDFQGNLLDETVSTVLRELPLYTKEITVLGSYPEGRILS
ncbi:MAG: prephenate dehydratase [Desulfomonilia bacterium]